MVSLTGKAEAIENRLNRVVTDGTNRIGDIEFRLTELAGGDLGAVPPTPPLGGEAAPVAQPRPGACPFGGGPELAVNEQAEFDRARGCSVRVTFVPLQSSLRPLPRPFPVGP